MYLFTRSARLGPGRIRESMAWAVEITEKVNQIGEMTFTLWSTTMSPGVGRLVWAAQAEELEQLEAVEGKLLADDSYVALVDRGAEFSSGDVIDDHLLQIIHDASDPAAAPSYVSVVDAVAANGQFARAIEVGVAIAEAAQRIGGSRTSFGVSVTGGYGHVQWVTGYHDLGELQRAESTVNSSAEFMELLDRDAAAAYLPGISTQLIARKIM